MTTLSTTMDEKDLLIHKLNLETSRIQWAELQRQFAAGKVIYVSKTLDLLKTAEAFGLDQSSDVKKWIDTGAIHAVTDDQAKTWINNSVDVWAVVVSPWVLVQEC